MDILLVDDHADTTRLLALLLARQGHRVRQANDYDSALLAARTSRPELLICDIGLDDVRRDGCDLLADVLNFYPVKAFALTGYDSPEIHDRIRRAGFSGYLTKPVAFEHILKAIDNVAAIAASELISPARAHPSPQPT